MRNILVFDIGTSSMRGTLYGPEGQALLKSQIKYNPSYLENGYVEQNPSAWEQGLRDIASEISRQAALSQWSIGAVAVTSQRSSVIPLNQEGSPLHPAIMWQDKRTCGICEEMESKNKEVYLRTGSKINPIFAAPKMTWIKRNLPQLYSQTDKMVTIHDYVLFLLTGDYVTDHTIASRSLLFNIHESQWDRELLQLFEVEEAKLCRLVEPGAVCGSITGDMAQKTGLQQGIPVITAGGDQQCAALGLNIIQQGTLEVNTGTGSYIIACSDQPRLDEKMRIVCNAAAIPGKYILEAGIPTTGTIYRWFDENFYPEDAGQGHAYRKMNQDATEAPIGANGVVLLPHFQGRGSPHFNPLAKGMFFNITLGTKRSDFARAILEGIASEIDENIQVIQEMVGGIETISAAGGLTRFDLFNQIQADMYQKKIICYENEEASSLGAWMSAAKTLEIFNSYEAAFQKATEGSRMRAYESSAENAKRYEELKKRRKVLYDALELMKVYSAFAE